MTDLHDRLEDLTSQAVRDAAVPAPEGVVRRGRRRRQRRVAATALVVAALAAVAVPTLRSNLAGHAIAPAGGPPPIERMSVAGFSYGRFDASVFLTSDVTIARREAIDSQLRASPLVYEIFYESRQQAYERFQAQFRDAPEMVRGVGVDAMPESFHVVLTSPDRYQALHDLLCTGHKERSGREICDEGIDLVADPTVLTSRLLVGTYWPGRADVSVLLTMGVTEAERSALQTRLGGLGMVASVAYESGGQALERLPRDLRAQVPEMGASMPASFRVALDDPGQVDGFLRALCHSARTGDCADGVAMVRRHPRR
jgi:cell division protein FtsX